MTESALPVSARLVIIGGGIVGCNAAYQLALVTCMPPGAWLVDPSL